MRPRSFIRTPLACNLCRRRKTKCDGCRPRCGYCTSKKAQCMWPTPDPEHENASSPLRVTATPGTPGTPRANVSPPQVASALPTPIVSVESNSAFQRGLRLCLDFFFERHFASDFCSFDYRSSFETKVIQEELFSSSILALCGRYLGVDDAQALFGLSSGRHVSRHYLQRARLFAKLKSDEPSVSHIQANLIIGMTELLGNSGARHWLFIGTAIRMAEIMRLNKEFHQKHSLRDQEIRRRTFWACLMFDRALAYLLAKHRTINIDTVGIAMPGSDASLAYGEETRGVALQDLSGQQRPSDLGIIPYLIKTVSLWSNMVDFVVYSRRQLDWYPPNDPRSTFFTSNEALQSWINAVPASLRWSQENYRNQRDLGQGRAFVAMQFLLYSASCAAHQCYLPHLTAYTKLTEQVDASGWSYLHRETSLIKACVTSALKVGEMSSYLAENPDDRSMLQTVWAASSIRIAANALLWLQYTEDNEFADEETTQKAKEYFTLIRSLMKSWVPEWKAAQQWLTGLDVMHDLYKAAYLGEIDESILGDQGSTAAPSPEDEDVDEDGENDFRPQPGDGYPSLVSLPNLQASVKFATGDTSAKSISVLSIWLQLSGGWPYGLTGAESVFDSVRVDGNFDSILES